ncbi:NAD(P)H-hydrate dehydratase [Bosea sp. PAMC 26642]|uniref:NAD(P)H-hydrate dehydratase n=1 Tax=Bosea sp. (strain PAMC 26642) TaxID=1792307 RepID=UPI002FF8E6FC
MQALLTVAEMAAADRTAIAAGVPASVLMEQAGRAVADAAGRRLRPGDAVLVLCGPGDNGGDGFVAARVLRERGFAVTLAGTARGPATSSVAAEMTVRWLGPAELLEAVDLSRYALVVDALFGAGLSRSLTGQIAAAVCRVNESDVPVLAVDVPSGVSGDSGRVDGVALRAAETVTFFRLKPGHLLQPGRTLCGTVTLAQIGIAPEVAFAEAKPRTFRNGPALWRATWPHHSAETHKFQRGAVLVAAGGLESVGAPRLSARSALRIGAGLATIACRPEALATHAARGPDALMQRPVADARALDTLLGEKRLGAVLAGPALGLDAQARAMLASVLRSRVPAVLDADALTLLAARPRALRRSVAARGAPCVLTPHEGEFKRLFGERPEIADASSKLERARLAAAVSGAVIVLKGSDTVIAAPEGEAVINTTGSPALATAGSGDVLAGLIAGLLAQGMPAFEAACAAVWLHGKAGEHLGFGLIADDLPEAIPRLLSEMEDAAQSIGPPSCEGGPI